MLVTNRLTKPQAEKCRAKNICKQIQYDKRRSTQTTRLLKSRLLLHISCVTSFPCQLVLQLGVLLSLRIPSDSFCLLRTTRQRERETTFFIYLSSPIHVHEVSVEKPAVAQTLKKFPVFYGNQGFNIVHTVHTRGCPGTYPETNESSPPSSLINTTAWGADSRSPSQEIHGDGWC